MPSRRRRGYWIPGLIALAVLLGIGLAFGAGDLDHSGPTTLAGPEIAENLAGAIQASEGTPSPPTVHCPHSEPARAGLQFVCTVGEAGTTASIAAVMNAVADALPGGAGAHLDMPVTAMKLWEACRRAEQDSRAAGDV